MEQGETNVDIVADAANWAPDRRYDLVLCTEVFEHAPAWPAICRTAYAACAPGGRFVTTMAGPGRPAHSGIDGGWPLQPGEHYANIHPHRLRRELAGAGWADIIIDTRADPADVRAAAIRSKDES